MTQRLPQNLRENLAAFAEQLGVTWDELVTAAGQHPLATRPGKLVDGEKPLPIGSILNLRREMPDGKKADDDKGWVVAGYLQSYGGRWTGYDLRRGPWQIESNTVSKAEAFDVVEHHAPGVT